MNDVEDLFISREELDRITRDRRAELARQVRRDWWRNTGKTATIISQWVAMAGLGAFIWVRPAQTDPVPIIVYQKADGQVVNYAAWASLPAEVREDTTINVLWNYVQQRESWSEGNAGWAWAVVSAMSSAPIRDQFQAWYRKENPTSPARLYPEGTTVETHYVNWTPACPLGGCSGSPDAYRIWFDRYETPLGSSPQLKGHYAVTIRIKRNVPLPQDRLWERWTFNAPLIQVVEYLGPQREGLSK
jgi:hypothetical protein